MTGAGTILPPEASAGRFHVPGPGPYLLSHSAGALPVAARGRLEAAYLGPWESGGGDAWGDWLAAIDGFRGSLSALLDTAPAQICPQPHVTAGFANWLGAIAPSGGRNEIVLAPGSFPSLGYAAQALERDGWAVRYLPADADVTDTAAWAAMLGPRTGVVLVTHVFSNTGACAPVADIVGAAHGHGARVIVDVAQSVGVVPIDLAGWGADAVTGSCLKWLCGGAGAGWLWINAEGLDALDPRAVGWFSHADPFEMDIHRFRPAPDARRFWGGTPDIAPFVLAQAGIDEIARIGVPAIRAHNLALQGELRARLAAVTPQWSWPQGPAGGTLCLDTGADRDRVAAALAGAGVRADFRKTTLRLSFHAYNTLADVAAVARACIGGSG